VTYIRPTITVDEDEVRSQVYTSLQTRIPGWTPRKNSPTTHLIEVFIRRLVEQRAVFVQIPDDVFEGIGRIYNINRLAATPALGVAIIPADDSRLPSPPRTAVPLDLDAGAHARERGQRDLVEAPRLGHRDTGRRRLPHWHTRSWCSGGGVSPSYRSAPSYRRVTQS
jgi:hypothetical protein